MTAGVSTFFCFTFVAYRRQDGGCIAPKRGRRIPSPGSCGGAAAPQRNPGVQLPQPLQNPAGVTDTHIRGASWPIPIPAFSITLCFPPRAREPWLQGELRPRLWEYLSGAIRGEGGFCLVANGVADHVHLRVRLRQDKAVSDVLRAIKANSSGWIREGFPTSFARQAGG